MIIIYESKVKINFELTYVLELDVPLYRLKQTHKSRKIDLDLLVL